MRIKNFLVELTFVAGMAVIGFGFWRIDPTLAVFYSGGALLLTSYCLYTYKG